MLQTTQFFVILFRQNICQKKLIGWRGSFIIPINSINKSKHCIEFYYATGKIVFKNPEANTCWGDFEKFWLLNRL
jgi:hypothetical protein